MRAYERLLNYVRVHTTSDETSGTHPSAEREFDLARQLVEEIPECFLHSEQLEDFFPPESPDNFPDVYLSLQKCPSDHKYR